MKDQKPSAYQNIEIFILSLGGIGFIPYAPGTFGSAATVPLLYFAGKYQIPTIFLMPIVFLGFVGSCYIADMYQRKFKLLDPSWIVIDEAFGMLCVWFFYPTANFWHLLLMFSLFRLFDITKPWPIYVIDQRVKNGLGVMLDDIAAGIYAGISFLILKFLFF